MAVCLLHKDYATNYCEFSFDNWVTDSVMLPNLNTSGKSTLSAVKSCCQGSLAKGTDGTMYILTGENKWISYISNTSGGGSGGDTPDSDNGFIEL